LLWEHLVLDTLMATPVPRAYFWRDTAGREVDFVVPRTGGSVDAIECKWNSEAFEAEGLKKFRESYPEGRNFLVSPNITAAYPRNLKGLKVELIPISELRKAMEIPSERGDGEKS
jgi:predicted AAA+ superfamily ATPase